MTDQQTALIPDRLLSEPGTRGLRDWLGAYGLRMSLLELVKERRARGIRLPR